MCAPATMLMYAEQMIQRLQCVHSQGLLHLDVKPQNFLFGRGKNANQLHLIDFGLARPYLEDAHQHLRYRLGSKHVPGTATYAYMGIDPSRSRRDDLQSLCYALLRISRGPMPRIQAPRERILHKKLGIS